MTSLLDLLAAGLTGSPWWLIAIYFVVVMQLTIFSVTLYLHRSQAHRSVEFHPVIAHFFRFWAWLTTAMVTKEWVAIHRLHHARCETEEDPHSPLIHGIGKVVCAAERRVLSKTSPFAVRRPLNWSPYQEATPTAS